MSVVVLLVSLIMVMLFNGCRESNAPQANSAASKSANTSPTPQSAFERDLQYARSSQNFTKVYVFARKDGNTIESADGDLLKAKAPADPHIWWVLTDENARYHVYILRLCAAETKLPARAFQRRRLHRPLDRFLLSPKRETLMSSPQTRPPPAQTATRQAAAMPSSCKLFMRN
jgi:hypothetical protein